MKIKFHHVLLILFLVTVTPAGILSVQAQDASYPLLEADDADADREREKIMYSPGEADPLLNNKVHVLTSRDSIATRAGAMRPVKSQAEAAKNSAKPSQEDDSILSFNFLYYLFEKYKLQGMVD